LIYFTYIENKGAAFGLFQGQNLALIIVGIAVALIVFYFHVKMSKKNVQLQIPLAFVFGGTLSNLFDRIFRSYVIDFIDLRIWPVFNISDVMINIGVILLLYRIIFSPREKSEER